MRKSFSGQEGNERRESPAKISLRIIPLAGSSVRQALLRCEISTPPMTALGHSRRSDGQQGFAECPLCFQWRPNLCVATNRRDVPQGDIRACSKSRLIGSRPHLEIADRRDRGCGPAGPDGLHHFGRWFRLKDG
jgi:hypothetical protein